MILIKVLFSINIRYMKNTTSFLSTNIVSAKRAICDCAIAELWPSLQQRVICVECKVNSLWLPREQNRYHCWFMSNEWGKQSRCNCIGLRSVSLYTAVSLEVHCQLNCFTSRRRSQTGSLGNNKIYDNYIALGLLHCVLWLAETHFMFTNNKSHTKP